MTTLQKFIFRFVILAMYACPPVALAHDNHTIHPTLTDKAYDAWVQKDNEEFFKKIGIKQDGKFSFPTWPSDADSLTKQIKIGATTWSLTQPATLKDWLIAGSIDEDAPDSRGFAHFYNPLGSSQNLTDPINISGRNFFEWASDGTSFTPNALAGLPSPGTIKKGNSFYRRIFVLGISPKNRNGLTGRFSYGKIRVS